MTLNWYLVVQFKDSAVVHKVDVHQKRGRAESQEYVSTSCGLLKTGDRIDPSPFGRGRRCKRCSW